MSPFKKGTDQLCCQKRQKELYEVKSAGDIKLISQDSSGREEKINYTCESPGGDGLDVKLNPP